jgi:hypothetical protein
MIRPNIRRFKYIDCPIQLQAIQIQVWPSQTTLEYQTKWDKKKSYSYSLP